MSAGLWCRPYIHSSPPHLNTPPPTITTTIATDLDVVVANIEAGVNWYENVNGAGTVWNEKLIDGFEADFRRMGVATADLNGDGTEDVIVASSAGDRISWYPNIQTPRLAPTMPPTSPPVPTPPPSGPTPPPTPPPTAPTPPPTPPPTASPTPPPGATLAPTFAPPPPATTAAPSGPTTTTTPGPGGPAATTAEPASGGVGQFNVDDILGNNDDGGIQLSLIPFIPIAFVAGGVLVYLVLSNRRPRKSASVSSGYSRGSYGRGGGYGRGSYYEDDRGAGRYLVNGGAYSYDSYDPTTLGTGGATSATSATYYSSTGGYTGASTSGA